MVTADAWMAVRTSRVVTIRLDDTIAKAALEMRDNKVGSLIVVDESGALAGIMTERDIVNQSTAASANPEDMKVSDVMTSSPIWCDPDTPVSRAREVLASHGIRHLPIVKDGKPVGMISSRDVLAYQLELNKAMKAAAEEVALTGAGLKSLDLDEVLGLVTSEVPKIFHARRCLLRFMDDLASGETQAFVRGVDCPRRAEQAAGEDGLPRELPAPKMVSADVPSECRQLGGEGPNVVLALPAAEQNHGGEDLPGQAQSFLCMCGLAMTEASSDELLTYEAGLVSDIISVYLRNARLYREVRRNSLIDALTGVGTRQAMEEKLAVECRRATRYGRPFSIAMLDLDDFKSVNDRYGHAGGDRMLRRVAGFLHNNTRGVDVTARYGGDEFVVLMPETHLEEATTAMDRLRSQVHARLSTPDGRPVTISCGVAEWSRHRDESPSELLRRADLALYEAKRHGRNRVAAAAPLPPAAAPAPAP